MEKRAVLFCQWTFSLSLILVSVSACPKIQLSFSGNVAMQNIHVVCFDF